MNLMKVFLIGRRESDAFATQHGCELDDGGTVAILQRIKKGLVETGTLSSQATSLLSFVTLLSAQRYFVHAERFLKSCQDAEHAGEFGLATVEPLIDELCDTLGFYAAIEMAESLPVSTSASVEVLTNHLFAAIAVHDPKHVLQMTADWAEPKTLAILQSAARDPEGYEPVFSPTFRQFVGAIEKTHCIFAPSGKYWGADEWREEESLEENVARFARGLFRFMAVGKKETFKGLAMRLPAAMSDSVERLAETTATILAELNRIDPAGSRCLDKPIGEEGWKYEWAGETMFFTVFGTCYPENHPRNPHGFGYTYFFIQPDFVLRNHPKMSPENEADTRARILANFNKHGMTFSNENKRSESERYIRPLDPEDPPVRWWEYLQKSA